MATKKSSNKSSTAKSSGRRSAAEMRARGISDGEDFVRANPQIFKKNSKGSK